MKRHHLRGLVPDWVDGVLREWVAYMHAEDGLRELGYPNASSFAKGTRNVSGYDDLEEEVGNWRGRVADSIIDSMSVPHQMAISNIYLAHVFDSPRWSIELVFPEAIEEFAGKARRRGLV